MECETMVSAVIVTYNRKKLLYENIKMLLCQTYKIDKIYVVDNCSTDGTYEFLREQELMNNPNFIYVKTESNIGGAGGFYLGVKRAYEDGADWIVLMDDDGKAEDNHTIEQLMNVAERLYMNNTAEKKIYVNALVLQKDMLSFKMGQYYTVEAACSAAVDGVLEGLASPFNGTLLSKELVEEIGYPNKDFFIKGDEVNFKQCSFDAGAYVATVADARYIHPRPETHEKTVLGIKVPFFVEAPWKEYYAARNFCYIYKQKGWYKAIAFELVFVKMLAICSMKCKKWKTIKMLFKGINDGWKGRLGATVKP